MTSKACDSRERKELYLCPLPDQGNFVVTMVDPVSASGLKPSSTGYGLRTCPFLIGTKSVCPQSGVDYDLRRR